jgi:hypothetical protein
LPQLEESCDDPKGSGTIWGSCKTWLWNFVLKGDVEERVGVAAGRRDLYL